MKTIEEQLEEYRRKRKADREAQVENRHQQPNDRHGGVGSEGENLGGQGQSGLFTVDTERPKSRKNNNLVFARKGLELLSTLLETVSCFFQASFPCRQLQHLKRTRPWTFRIILAFLWLIGQISFAKAHFGSVYFAISILVFIYWSLGNSDKRKKGELSAYSVFNPNCERLLGQTTAEQFEGELLRRNVHS